MSKIITGIALDLTQYHFKRDRGDITVFGTWYGKELEPVLVLMPTRSVSRPYPCVVTLQTAWMWSKAHGDEAHRLQMAGTFAAFLGLDPLSKQQVYRIISIIQDELIDVLGMPMKPVTEFVAADAIHTDHETGKVYHREIIDRV
ncbi:DNA methyltransferase [Serratia phage Parlo]|uniref:Uncharacterized protein n=1 Tax=Serratia phage Parlo TaxID=2557554 RepID=A0A482MG56_9CAUD|nr:DNA methyltransferase [Serratia phage Parlo]QBQ72208.1 hypothetical protein CPT_Parlo_059 [Serratia phage Parlo]HEJ7283122.1 hypothetical protein [Serratia marcescens]